MCERGRVAVNKKPPNLHQVHDGDDSMSMCCYLLPSCDEYTTQNMTLKFFIFLMIKSLSLKKRFEVVKTTYPASF